jgi:hypothetical protein
MQSLTKYTSPTLYSCTGGKAASVRGARSMLSQRGRVWVCVGRKPAAEVVVAVHAAHYRENRHFLVSNLSPNTPLSCKPYCLLPTAYCLLTHYCLLPSAFGLRCTLLQSPS